MSRQLLLLLTVLSAVNLSFVDVLPAAAQTRGPVKKKPAKALGKAPAKEIPPRQSPGFDGIGRLHINKTTVEELAAFALERGTLIKATDLAVPRDTFKDTMGVYELIAGPTGRYACSYASQCPGARTFLLPSLPVAGMNLENVYLTFYHGVLAKLECDWHEGLGEALALKYGPAEADITSKAVSCPGGPVEEAGAEKKEITSIDTWHNGPVLVMDYLKRTYDTDCARQYQSFFLVVDQDKGDALRAGAKAATARLDAR